VDHAVAQFTHAEDLRQRGKQLGGEPLRGMPGHAHGLHPLDKLVCDAQLAEPTGAGEAFLRGRRLGGGVGTRRGEIHDLPLMDTKDGMQPVLAQEGQMGKGTEGAISHQDVPRA
jgi:hypothetical protein